MRALSALTVIALVASRAHACTLGDLAQPPSVSITSTPGDCCYGDSAGTITGLATNIDTDSVVVVLYAQTDQYYIQPGAGESGKTPITCPSGSFSNSTRGGARYCAVLARKSWSPPATMTVLPQPGGPVLAIACSGNRPGGGRGVNFSNLPWVARSSGGSLEGPGPNVFSDSTANVWIDPQGRLHLKITHRNGGWQCAEVFTDFFLGYGRYRFEIETAPDSLDPNVVLGCFSYSDQYDADGDEIDIEFSRWSDPHNLNSQFVVQPYDLPGHLYRFDSLPADGKSFHEFVWSSDRVVFTSREGSWALPGAEIATWIYTATIPVPDVERMRFNLWLNQGTASTDGREVEVVVSAFRFFDVADVPGASGLGDAVFLAPPAPNPVSGRLSFAVRLARPGRAVVRLFDASGRLVSNVLDEVLPAGSRSASLNVDDAGGRRLPPGIYHLRLEAAGTSRTRRFTVVR